MKYSRFLKIVFSIALFFCFIVSNFGQTGSNVGNNNPPDTIPTQFPDTIQTENGGFFFFSDDTLPTDSTLTWQSITMPLTGTFDAFVLERITYGTFTTIRGFLYEGEGLGTTPIDSTNEFVTSGVQSSVTRTFAFLHKPRLIAGNKYTFQVKVTSGGPPPRFRWPHVDTDNDAGLTGPPEANDDIYPGGKSGISDSFGFDGDQYFTAYFTGTVDQGYLLAVGDTLFHSSSTGTIDTAIVPTFSLLETDSDNNTKFGTNALLTVFDTGAAGTNSTAIGAEAGQSQPSGDSDGVFVGYRAGEEGGDRTVAIGSQAGENSTSDESVAIGWRAGRTANFTSSVIIGAEAGDLGTATSTQNVFLGAETGRNCSSCDQNIFIGYRTGQNVFTGTDNVFIGPDNIGTAQGNVSNRLLINNVNSSIPLIDGDFAADTIRFNADVGLFQGTPFFKLIDTDVYSRLQISNETNIARIDFIAPGASNNIIRINPRPDEGTGALIDLFRETNTTNLTKGVRLFEGLNTGNIQTFLRANTDSYLQNVAGNLAIGHNQPDTKVHIQGGDLYVEGTPNGVILQSPDNACWRITVNNSGALVTTSITCP